MENERKMMKKKKTVTYNDRILDTLKVTNHIREREKLIDKDRKRTNEC